MRAQSESTSTTYQVGLQTDDVAILSVELVPYVREGHPSDEFLICQPEFRCRRQPWTRKVSQGMAVEIVESGEKCPGQANGDDGDEDVLEERGELRHGTTQHASGQL